MAKNSKNKKSAWLRLKKYKPGFYRVIIILLVIGVVFSIFASLYLGGRINFPEKWYQPYDKVLAFLKIDKSKENNDSQISPLEANQTDNVLFLNVNYPTQFNNTGGQDLFIQAHLANNFGPVGNQNVWLALTNAAGISIFQGIELSNNMGVATFQVTIPEYEVGTLTGMVYTDAKEFPLQIQLISYVDFMERDFDNDGLKDVDELVWRTDYRNPDTDSDSFSDKSEIDMGQNPLVKDPIEFSLQEGQSVVFYRIIEGDFPLFSLTEPSQYQCFVENVTDEYYEVYFWGFVNQASINLDTSVVIPGTIVYADEALTIPLFNLYQKSELRDTVSIDTITPNIRIFSKIQRSEIEALMMNSGN